LLARHTAVRTRPAIEAHLEKNTQRQLENRLKQRLSEQLPKWQGSFFKVLSAFEDWLRDELTAEVSAISAAHQDAFCRPLREVQRQCQGNLQSFRDQLSNKVMKAFGVPLHTTETEIEVQAPRSPDISVSRVFDHNWEVISFLIPMPLVRWAIERRFYERVESDVYKSLSRLTAQWEEKVHEAIFRTAKEAERRFDELVMTVSHLLSGEDQQTTAKISSYLERARKMLKHLVGRTACQEDHPSGV
jgi:hypothetical protein